MKFVWVPSINRYRRTETEVRKEKLDYEVVEHETDKDSLIEIFNKYEERIEALWAELRESPETVATEAPPSGIAEAMAPPEVETIYETYGSSQTPAQPGTGKLFTAENIDEDATFNARVLIEQVEALGSADAPAVDKLEEIDGFQRLTGVGFAFSRGVHLLSVIAAGEHQLAGIFQRRRKKFG